MRSIIIYFSQTGNTERVARCIQDGIIQTTGQCDLQEIRQTNPLGLKDYDLIGFGSPIIGQCPTNVLEFVRRLKFVGGKHAFTFSTHGTGYKRFHPSIYPALVERGLTVIGTADWYADCYLLHMPQPYPTAGHLDEIDLQEAEAFGREMAVRAMRVRAGETDLIPEAPEPLPVPPAPADGQRPAWLPPSFTEMLVFHKEKCVYPSCTLCMDSCPTYGMDLSMDPPVLAEPCIYCEFCARICPTGALDMDAWLKAMVEMTAPHADKMMGSLEEAEAIGHFRRLIPASEIDPTRPGYKQYTTHPQWIIGKGPQKDNA